MTPEDSVNTVGNSVGGGSIVDRRGGPSSSLEGLRTLISVIVDGKDHT